jgi:hypothetical protein
LTQNPALICTLHERENDRDGVGYRRVISDPAAHRAIIDSEHDGGLDLIEA